MAMGVGGVRIDAQSGGEAPWEEYAADLLRDLDAWEVDPNGETREQIVMEWIAAIRARS